MADAFGAKLPLSLLELGAADIDIEGKKTMLTFSLARRQSLGHSSWKGIRSTLRQRRNERNDGANTELEDGKRERKNGGVLYRRFKARQWRGWREAGEAGGGKQEKEACPVH